ncbi:hypothetical protein C8R43DRAFT_1138642 [Mycena crocata]|nr:hypothetical protein C8R43DRAFT_1138642 [Mycena crocata]
MPTPSAAMNEFWTLLTSSSPTVAEDERKTSENPGCAADENTQREQEGLSMEQQDAHIGRAEVSVTTAQHAVVPALDRKPRVFLSGTLRIGTSEYDDRQPTASYHHARHVSHLRLRPLQRSASRPAASSYFRGGFALGNKLGAREPLSNSNDFAKPAFVNNQKVSVRHDLDRRLSNSNDFAKPAFVNNKKVGVRHDINRRLSNSNDFAKPAFVNNKKIARQDSGIQCAPVDDDGTALTGSAGSGDFVTCTYVRRRGFVTDGANTIGASPTDTPDDPATASGDAPESPPPSIPTSSSAEAPVSTPAVSTPASTPPASTPSASATAGSPASPPAGSQTSAAASQTPSQSDAAMRLGTIGGGAGGMCGVAVAVLGVVVGAFVL